MDTSRFAATFGDLPRPSDPIDWAAVETWLGLTLPGDYKAIASAYGPLDIGEYVWLHVPCRQEGRFDYADWLRETHRRCLISSRMAPPFTPPPFHPAPKGLLAWGETRGTDVLFWDTSEPDPDRWPTVIYVAEAVYQQENPWHHYGLSTIEVLEGYASNGLEGPAGRRIGPLPAIAKPTAFLPSPQPFVAPQPKPRLVPEEIQRAALTQGTGLETLALLVPPPENPDLGTITWDELFAQLGTRLPSDYMELMEHYGAGIWSKWLRFEAISGLYDQADWFNDGYRTLRADYPEYHPLPMWPEAAGFLPFASSIDGDYLGWLTDGNPESWKLIIVPRHNDQGPPLPGDLVSTLLCWLRGKEKLQNFPVLDELDDPLDFIDFSPMPADALEDH